MLNLGEQILRLPGALLPKLPAEAQGSRLESLGESRVED